MYTVEITGTTQVVIDEVNSLEVEYNALYFIFMNPFLTLID